MNWLLRVRVLIAIVLGGLILGGCSSDGDDPAVADPTGTRPPSDTAMPSTVPSTVPSDATCQVKGFVPGMTLSAGPRGKTEPVVMIAEGMRGTGTSTTTTGDRYSAPVSDIAVRVTSGNGPVDPVDAHAILATRGGPTRVADLAEPEFNVRVSLADTGRFVVYRTSRLVSGGFTVRACGAPYNDGSAVDKITGTYLDLEKPSKTLIVHCADQPADKLARKAQRVGCDA